MSNVIVTGGAGYIGSHTCKALAQAGYAPIAYDSLVRGHRSAVRWGPLIEGDIADQDRLGAVFEHYRPVAVIHFAAFAYVGESTENPALYYRNNVLGTLALLESMVRARVENLVFSSSCATYGTPARVPITEDAAQSPINPYGSSKLMCERMAADMASAGQLKSVALRYFNAAGADPDGELGEDHDPETHLIPLVLDAAMNQSAVTIFGDDYDTPDGTCIRDYVHVTDLAEAHVAALEALPARTGATAYNLGSGTGISVRQLIASAEQVSGRAIEARVGPRREGDPAILVADPSRANAELGWRTKRSSLDDILEIAWAWANRRE
jgi:UDP-arabinose 4-epimerase